MCFYTPVWADSRRTTVDTTLEIVRADLGVTSHDGWWLAEARDISADGRTIVGTANTPERFLRGFVATIPVSEIFADDFEDNTLSRWWSVVGGQ